MPERGFAVKEYVEVVDVLRGGLGAIGLYECSLCLTRSPYCVHFVPAPQKSESRGGTLASSLVWHVFDGTMKAHGMNQS